MKNILLIFLCAITLSFSACSSDTYPEDIIYPDEVTDVRALISGNRYINIDNPYYKDIHSRIIEFGYYSNEFYKDNYISYECTINLDGNSFFYTGLFSVYDKLICVADEGNTKIRWTIINSDTIIGTNKTIPDWEFYYGTWVKIK